MKKKSLLLLSLLLACIFRIEAQLQNPGFENINASGNLSNWSNTTFIAIGIDSNGKYDSVIIDKAFYFPTSDAHTGSKAMEMRNAYNFTSNTPYAGTAIATTNDSEYASFNSMIPVQSRPGSLDFYYKYFPVAGESAHAELTVYDSSGNEIGHVVFMSPGVTSVYSLASVPVTYTDIAPAAFVKLTFSTCMPSQVPALGTKFLVDDVSINSATSVDDKVKKQGGEVICYPTNASDKLHLSFGTMGSKEQFSLMVTDAQGKIILHNIIGYRPDVSMDVSSLAPGMYFIKVENDRCRLNGKFVKQ